MCARGTVGAPVKLCQATHPPNGFPGYDVAADGRFILIKQTPASDTVFQLVLGWDRELTRASQR